MSRVGLTALASIIVANAGIAQSELPERIYFLVESYSDADPFESYGLLDVRSAGGGYVVEITALESINHDCGPIGAWSVSSYVAREQFVDLVGPSNPCSADEKEIQSALEGRYLANGMEHPEEVHIVAGCGGRERTFRLLQLPREAQDALEQRLPIVAGLRDLPFTLIEHSIDDEHPFGKLGDEKNWMTQLAARPIVERLRAGRYDKLLPTCDDPQCDKDFWRHFLSGYEGPVRQPRFASAQLLRRISAPSDVRFLHYDPAFHSPDAARKGTQGVVVLELFVDNFAGDIRGIIAKEGLPELVASALPFVRRWKIDPSSVGSEKVEIALEFSNKCRD